MAKQQQTVRNKQKLKDPPRGKLVELARIQTKRPAQISFELELGVGEKTLSQTQNSNSKLVLLPEEFISAVDSSAVEAQATQLSDPRLPTVQRQALATHIGQIQGNHHLQAVAALLKAAPVAVIQREPKDHAKLEQKVKKLVADNKHDEALELICKEYGFTGANFEIKVVPAMADSWATTGGEIKEGAKQTLSIGKDLFDKSFVFIVRTIGHEFQHLKQRSQKDPIQNQKEREFLSWAWEALDTSAPAYPLQEAADHAKTALKYYEDMPDDRKPLYKDKKKELEQLIEKAKAAKK